ncbi:unnamed protein product [Amoebophrya sp. A25]|nr:unnamed protein product [Amoebophrya sp. A25]|eukprot:GSA25T00002627001.1
MSGIRPTVPSVLPADGSVILFADRRRGVQERNPAPGVAELFQGDNASCATKMHKVAKDGVFLQLRTSKEFEARRQKVVELLSEVDAQADAARTEEAGEEGVPEGGFPPTEYAVIRDTLFAATSTPSTSSSTPMEEDAPPPPPVANPNAVKFGELALSFVNDLTVVNARVETDAATFLSKQTVDELHALAFSSEQPADGGEAPPKPNLLEFPAIAELMPDDVEFEYRHRPVKLSYTLENSQKIEVHPDGSCFVKWPTGGGPAQQGGVGRSAGVAGSDACYYEAGQVEDSEVCRKVQPDGTFMRFLRSTRIELYYADGTVAYRNPTVSELAEVPAEGDEWLAHLQLSYGNQDVTDDNAIQAGLPGHWVVTKLDGRRVGRGDNVEELTEGLRVVLKNLRMVDDGEKFEYDLKPVSTVKQQDPSTGYWVTTSATGLMMLESEDKSQQRVITNDATVITTQATATAGITDVIIEKPDVMPKIVIVWDNYSLQRNTKMSIYATDGSVFEVTPKELNHDGKLVPCPVEHTATHTAATLRHASSSCLVKSDGLGEVDVFTKGDVDEHGEEALLKRETDAGFYTVNLTQNEMRLMDKERNKFCLNGDQTVDFQLAVSMSEDGKFEEPKCAKPLQQYCHPEAAFLPVPPTAPPPRLFVIYADGEAEELVEKKNVDEAFFAVKDIDEVVCVRDEALQYPLEGCRSNTIYKSLPTMPRGLRYHEKIVLPDCVRGIYSPMDKLDAPIIASDAIPEFTSFTQWIEYPKITDSRKAEFLQIKKNYHRWELEHSAVWAEIQRKEAEKKAKDAKKKKKPDAGKKGKKEEAAPEPVEEEKYEGPPFSMDQLMDKVIAFRAQEAPRVPASRMFDDLEKKRPEVMATRIQSSLRAKRARQEVAERRAEADRKKKKPAAVVLDESLKKVELTEEDSQKKPMTHVDLGLNFKYFASQKGLKFLLESGLLDPDVRSHVLEKPKMPDLDLDQKIKSIWQPRLVFEEENVYLDTQQLFENSHADFDYGYERGLSPENTGAGGDPIAAAEHESTDKNYTAQLLASGGRPMEQSDLGDDTFFPSPREDRRPSRCSSPKGPHPDKKGPHWDVYGNKRMVGKPISQAFISVNDAYLQREGPTDKRTRTSSLVNKKNALEAPGVQQVLKSGCHVLTGDPKQTLARAKGAVQALKTEDASKDLKWELSATMQGLGDPNKLVEAVPGHVRFGLLRRGAVYQITLQLKNLDCEPTRFNIKQPDSEYVKIAYSPMPVAPGLSMNVSVELWGWHSAKILQVIEASCKAAIVKIPVSARVVEAEEYDRLDAESVLLNGKRIMGSHVRLQEYSSDKLGAAYIAPNDFQSMAEGHGDESEMLLKRQQQLRVYGSVERSRDEDGGDDVPQPLSYSDPEEAM